MSPFLSVQNVRHLSAEDYNKHYRLNFRIKGCMQEELRYWRRGRGEEHGLRADVYARWDGGTLLSWALVFPNHSHLDFDFTPMCGEDKEMNAYFYTRARVRNMGHGTVLLNEIRNFHPDILVYPHDERSRGFFKKVPDHRKM